MSESPNLVAPPAGLVRMQRRHRLLMRIVRVEAIACLAATVLMAAYGYFWPQIILAIVLLKLAVDYYCSKNLPKSATDDALQFSPAQLINHRKAAWVIIPIMGILFFPLNFTGFAWEAYQQLKAEGLLSGEGLLNKLFMVTGLCYFAWIEGYRLIDHRLGRLIMTDDLLQLHTKSGQEVITFPWPKIDSYSLKKVDNGWELAIVTLEKEEGVNIDFKSREEILFRFLSEQERTELEEALDSRLSEAAA